MKTTLLSNIAYYGVTEDFFNIQKVEVTFGRTLQQADLTIQQTRSSIGNEVAQILFGEPENAIGKTVKLKEGKTANIVGLIKKQGKSILQTWEFDNCIIMPTGFMKQMIPERWSNPKIIVQGKEGYQRWQC